MLSVCNLKKKICATAEQHLMCQSWALFVNEFSSIPLYRPYHLSRIYTEECQILFVNQFLHAYFMFVCASKSPSSSSTYYSNLQIYLVCDSRYFRFIVFVIPVTAQRILFDEIGIHTVCRILWDVSQETILRFRPDAKSHLSNLSRSPKRFHLTGPDLSCLNTIPATAQILSLGLAQ